VLATTTAWKPVHGVYVVLLAATLVVWVLAELRQAVRRRPEASRVAVGDELVLRLSVAAGALVAVLAGAKVPGAAIRPTALAAWLGLVFLWCGVALRIWCFQTLGRYFTLTVRTSGDQPVISNGPYRYLRHPSYLGLLLAVTGIGFFIGNWLSLLALVTGATVGLVYRIRVEERALLHDLGDRYRDYAATRKRLIPFLW
jgi:protein-S-isoprenylcysteine O-methyltransferase Ste14